MGEMKIGVVAEGISDYWVIKHIVEHFLRDEGAYTIPLQPKITPTGRQDGFGGWQKVFEYLSQKEYIIELAQTEGCRCVIAHLDTDMCEAYGVKKSASPTVLFDNVLNKIKEITHADYDKSKIVPAICIHSLECWMVPFVSNDPRKCAEVNNCIGTINYLIRVKGTIDKGNKGNAKPLFDYILAEKKKKKEIQEVAKYNVGFAKFIESLSSLSKG